MSIPSNPSPAYSPVIAPHFHGDDAPAADDLRGRPTGTVLMANAAADSPGGVLGQLAAGAWATLCYLASPQAGKDAAAGSRQIIDAVKPYYGAARHWSAKQARVFLNFYGKALQQAGYPGLVGNTSIGIARLTPGDVRVLKQVTARAAREYDRLTSVRSGASKRPSPAPANNIVRFATGKPRDDGRTCEITPPMIFELPRNGGYNFNTFIKGSPQEKVSGVKGTMTLTLPQSGQTFSSSQRTNLSVLGLPLKVSPKPASAAGGQLNIFGECDFKDGPIVHVKKTFPVAPGN